LNDLSSASSTCRCELQRSRLLAACLLLLGGLAVLSLMLSALTSGMALAISAMATALAVFRAAEEIRRPPQTLLLGGLGEPATVIEHGAEHIVTLEQIGFRASFVLLAWRDAQGRIMRRTLWPDALPEAQRRALRRRFGAGGDAVAASMAG